MNAPNPPTLPPPFPFSRVALVELAAFGGIIAGSFGPWATLLGFSENGMDMDGPLTLTAGAIGLLAAIAGIGRWGAYQARISFFAGAAACGVGIYNWNRVGDIESGSYLYTVEPGWGLILVTILGGLSAIVGLFGVAASRTPASATEPAQPSERRDPFKR